MGGIPVPVYHGQVKDQVVNPEYRSQVSFAPIANGMAEISQGLQSLGRGAAVQAERQAREDQYQAQELYKQNVAAVNAAKTNAIAVRIEMQQALRSQKGVDAVRGVVGGTPDGDKTSWLVAYKKRLSDLRDGLASPEQQYMFSEFAGGEVNSFNAAAMEHAAREGEQLDIQAYKGVLSTLDRAVAEQAATEAPPDELYRMLREKTKTIDDFGKAHGWTHNIIEDENNRELATSYAGAANAALSIGNLTLAKELVKTGSKHMGGEATRQLSARIDGLETDAAAAQFVQTNAAELYTPSGTGGPTQLDVPELIRRVQADPKMQDPRYASKISKHMSELLRLDEEKWKQWDAPLQGRFEYLIEMGGRVDRESEEFLKMSEGARADVLKYEKDRDNGLQHLRNERDAIIQSRVNALSIGERAALGSATTNPLTEGASMKQKAAIDAQIAEAARNLGPQREQFEDLVKSALDGMKFPGKNENDRQALRKASFAMITEISQVWYTQNKGVTPDDETWSGWLSLARAKVSEPGALAKALKAFGFDELAERAEKEGLFGLSPSRRELLLAQWRMKHPDEELPEYLLPASTIKKRVAPAKAKPSTELPKTKADPGNKLLYDKSGAPVAQMPLDATLNDAERAAGFHFEGD